MRHPPFAPLRHPGIALLVALALALGTAFTLMTVQPAPAAHNGDIAEMGTTGGWLDGRTVTFRYGKDFFCRQPPSTAADSSCEVGAESTVAPRPGQNIPVLHVMTPLTAEAVVVLASLRCLTRPRRSTRPATGVPPV